MSTASECLILVTGSRTFDVRLADNRTFRYPKTRKRAGAWLADTLARLDAEALARGQALLVIHGGADGPDKWAGAWCERHKVQFRVVHPDYEKHSKTKAPLIRNTEMAEMVKAGGGECVAVWDGQSRGTDQTVRECERLGVPVTLEEFDVSQEDSIDAQFEESSPPPSPPPSTAEAPKAEAQAPEKAEAEPSHLEKVQGAIMLREAEGKMLSAVGLQIQNLNDALTYAKRLCQTQLVPRALQENVNNTLLVILRGADFGFSPVQSTQFMFVAEGNVGMKADIMQGLVMRSGLCEYFDMTELDDDHCTFVTKRKGARSERPFTFTYQMAVDSGAAVKGHRDGKKNNYDTQRRFMLIARARAALARLEYPDVVGGIYTPEELLGGPLDAPTVTVTMEPPKTGHQPSAAAKGKTPSPEQVNARFEEVKNERLATLKRDQPDFAEPHVSSALRGENEDDLDLDNL